MYFIACKVVVPINLVKIRNHKAQQIFSNSFMLKEFNYFIIS